MTRKDGVDSFFAKEEQHVSDDFDRKYKSWSELVTRCLRTIEELIKSSGFRTDQYPEYSIILHALHALMALSNGLVLLSRGYMGDCEAVHKRAVEFLLRAIYFREFPEEEAKWREKRGKLPDRRVMADLLDKKHTEKPIFPTDHDKLWGDFVYGTIDKTVNEWAHGDFDAMYYEVAIDDQTPHYTHRFHIGPKPDDTFTKIMLRRLLHSCRMQILILALTFDAPRDKYHDVMMESEQFLLTT